MSKETIAFSIFLAYFSLGKTEFIFTRDRQVCPKQLRYKEAVRSPGRESQLWHLLTQLLRNLSGMLSAYLQT